MDSETYVPQNARLRGRSAGVFDEARRALDEAVRDEARRVLNAVASTRPGTLAMSARDFSDVRISRPDWRCRIGLHTWVSREMNPSRFIQLWDAPSCARCGKVKR
jgi:hypothetical protein